MILQTLSAFPDYFDALLLAVVEGFTEFLPISSTAHLILAARVLRLEQTEFLKSFEVIIQLGAILSVVVLYWKKFWNRDILIKLAVAFFPTGLIGLTVYRLVKSYLFGNMTVVLAALLIGGIALIVFDKYVKSAAPDAGADFAEITYKKAALIGLFQSLAMVPGVSRSAATIVGGSMIGISKRTIVEFSFMLAVPTMLAASVLDLVKNPGILRGHVVVLGIGFVFSFVTAFIAIQFFLAFLKTRRFAAFGWYRIVLAIVFYVVYVRLLG